MRRQFDQDRMAVYADVEKSLSPIDFHKEVKKSGCITETSNGHYLVQRADLLGTPNQSAGLPLDFSTWLPFAAPGYHISPNPDDYVIVPVVIMPADIPNRNSVGFPLSELVRFHPQLGQQAYKTWKGKPTYREHQNDDITKAHGVIADAYMRKIAGYGDLWKVLLLLTFDRSKYPEFVASILDRSLNSYSMGAWVTSYRCSYCNAERGKCNHLSKDKPGPMYILNDKLVYSQCIGIEGFECSGVGTPAYVSAISDSISELR